MSGFQVNVSMSPDTVSLLNSSGSRLYVLRAVQSSDRLGRPVVWSVTQDFSATPPTPISVQAGLQAYTSLDPITKGIQIHVAFSAGIETGQTLHVEDKARGEVNQNGNAGTVSILNKTSTQFTCGLAGIFPDGTFAPFCAFPLFGNSLSTITPLDKILLMFSTDSIGIGTILEDPPAGNLEAVISPRLLIDMTGSSQSPYSVSFDINGGWKFPDARARSVLPNAKLVDLLIVPPPDSL